jgi:hypothetical protein
MNTTRLCGFLVLSLTILIGCSKAPEGSKGDATKVEPKSKELSPEKEAKIQAALDKLPEADRALALAQKYCPIQKTRLGIMGKPDRIEIEGQPVFLCCSSCEEDARANPKKTLEQVAVFKKEK